MPLREKIGFLWRDVVNQRILIHAYMLTRIQSSTEKTSSITDLIKDRVSVPGDNDNQKLQAYIDQMQREPEVLDKNGYVVDTGKPNKANPYYLVNQKIEEEVGNLDILRIRRSAHDLEGYTYARFYNLAFDPEHSHEFRTLVLDNLIALLDSENNQLTINTIPVSDFRNLEVFTLRHQNWGIVLSVCSDIVSDSGIIYATKDFGHEENLIPVVFGLAFTEGAQHIKGAYLINLLAYLKLSAELIKRQENLALLHTRFEELFSGEGGVVLISEWTKRLDEG